MALLRPFMASSCSARRPMIETEDRRAAEVARDLDVEHGDALDAGVGDLEQDRRRDDLADRLGHPQAAVGGHGAIRPR